MRFETKLTLPNTNPRQQIEYLQGNPPGWPEPLTLPINNPEAAGGSGGGAPNAAAMEAASKKEQAAQANLNRALEQAQTATAALQTKVQALNTTLAEHQKASEDAKRAQEEAKTAASTRDVQVQMRVTPIAEEAEEEPSETHHGPSTTAGGVEALRLTSGVADNFWKTSDDEDENITPASNNRMPVFQTSSSIGSGLGTSREEGGVIFGRLLFCF